MFTLFSDWARINHKMEYKNETQIIHVFKWGRGFFIIAKARFPANPFLIYNIVTDKKRWCTAKTGTEFLHILKSDWVLLEMKACDYTYLSIIYRRGYALVISWITKWLTSNKTIVNTKRLSRRTYQASARYTLAFVSEQIYERY
jgi:hypothetical protein